MTAPLIRLNCASAFFMSVIFKSMNPCVLLLVMVMVATAEPVQSLRLVNAVGGTLPLRATFDGCEVRAGGVAPSGTSGMIRVAAGGHDLRLRMDGVDESRIRIEMNAGESLLLVVYLERLEDGRNSRLRVLRMPSLDAGDKRVAVFVSVAHAPLVDVRMSCADGSRPRQQLRRMEPALVGIPQLRGYVPVWVDDVRLTSIPVGSPGSHVVVIHDAWKGGLQAMAFKDHGGKLGALADGQ